MYVYIGIIYKKQTTRNTKFNKLDKLSHNDTKRFIIN